MNKNSYFHYKLFIFSSLLIFTIIFAAQTAYSFVGTIKNVYELSAPIIKNLANIGKIKGSPEVGIELARLAKNVPASQLKYFYEVNYLKILVQQNRISPQQMDEYFKNLKDVKGFRNTLSKMVGKNTHLNTNVNSTGHGFELDVANTLARSKFKVISLGDKFTDGLKKAATDIDVIAEKAGKRYAFELKNYNKNFFKLEERKPFYDDIKSLSIYAKQNPNTQPVFLMKNVPDKDTVNHLIAMGKSENVIVGFGDPSHFIKMFLRTSK